jgi:hypothetical protein
MHPVDSIVAIAWSFRYAYYQKHFLNHIIIIKTNDNIPQAYVIYFLYHIKAPFLAPKDF